MAFPLRQRLDEDVEKMLIDISKSASAFLLKQISKMTIYFDKLHELIAEAKSEGHKIDVKHLLSAYSMGLTFYTEAMESLRKMILSIPAQITEEEEYIIKLFRDVPDSIRIKVRDLMKSHSVKHAGERFVKENTRIEKL